MTSLIERAQKQTHNESASVLDRFRREASVLNGGASDLAPLASGGVGVSPNQQFLDGYRSKTQYQEQEQRFRGWPFAAIRPIAQTIAGQSFMLAKEPSRGGNKASVGCIPGQLRKDGGKRDVLIMPGHGTVTVPKFVIRAMKRPAEGLELYESHPLLDILSHPNNLMVTWQFLYAIIGSLELTGWSHLWLTFSEGRRVIWPLPTSWVSPIHVTPDGRPKPFYGWNIRPGGSGEPVNVPGDEVVPIAYTNPSNLLAATSPMAAQSDAILTDESIQRAQREVMENSIWPRYAIVAGDIDDPDDLGGREQASSLGRPLLEQWQREELQSILKQLYGGTLNAGEPIVLDRLISEIKELGNKPAEMQFKESGEITKKRILTGYGTSGFVIGETEPTSRAASAVSRIHFADFTINPKIELVSQVLTNFVAPRLAKGGERLFLWIDPYEPEDREQTRKDVELAIKARAINRDEVRATLRGLSHLAPLDDGENVIVGMAEELQPLTATDRRQSGKSVEGHNEGVLLTKVARRLWSKSQEREEVILVSIIESLFEQQRASVIEQLEDVFSASFRLGRAASGIASLLFHPAEWYESWNDAIAPVLMGTAIRGAVDELTLVEQSQGKAPDPYIELPPDVAPYVRSEVDTIMGRPYWREIHQTTLNQLAETINEGMANGESLYELTVRIGVGPTVPGAEQGVLGTASNTKRAKLIARTETTGALNAGHQATQTGLHARGLIEKKQWLSLMDAMTRQTHADLHLVKVPVLGMFNVGGEMAPYPGYSGLSGGERCNCRCTTVSVIAK